MRPKRTDDKYWTGTRNFNHIQYESDLEDYIIDLENEAEQLRLGAVSNSAIGMEEILNEAQRRKAKHSVQYADYSLDTWTVASDLLEHRKKALLADGSVRKVRIEYEM